MAGRLAVLALALALWAATPAPVSTASSVRGVATWFDAPSRTDAAAGPVLRKLLGKHWRGSWVRVTSGGRSVTVQLTDWCACGERNGRPTVLDLDDVAFAALAPLGTGVIPVVVTAAGRSVTVQPTVKPRPKPTARPKPTPGVVKVRPTLPPTDTLP